MSNLARRAAVASVSTALFLGGLKAWAAAATGSVAVLASLADSVLDLAASLVTLAGVTYAAMPADREHRFGHGKAEAIAALFQVGVIAISAFAILLRAIERLVDARPTEHGELGIGVSIVAIVATLALTAYQRRVVAQTGSVAIGADRIHYESDLFLNAAVIAAIAIDQYAGLTGADAVFGLIIALWLLFGAWRASVEALNQLMDREWPAEKRRRFVEIAATHPELRTLHDLRTRTSGAKDFVQFHISLDPHMTVAEAHDVVEAIERALAVEFPDTEVLIHIDPEGQIDEPDNPLAEADEAAAVRQEMP